LVGGVVVPVDPQALASTLQVLLNSVDVPDGLSDQAMIERLDRVIDAAEHVLEVDGVGLMLLDEHGVLRVVGATDAAGDALERGQLRLEVGPAIECMRQDDAVMVADLADEENYAALWQWLVADSRREDLAGVPVRAVLSVPVRVAGRAVGTLNAFRSQPQRWVSEQTRAVEAYAGIIGVLLRLGARQADGKIRTPGMSQRTQGMTDG
jgi:GAF domain-containing protein